MEAAKRQRRNRIANLKVGDVIAVAEESDVRWEVVEIDGPDLSIREAREDATQDSQWFPRSSVYDVLTSR